MTELAAPVEVTTEAELREMLGDPGRRSPRRTDRRSTDTTGSGWRTHRSVSSRPSNADGTCDVSPKGDPPGFTLVLDDTTLAIPERPGNRRADGFRNILSNPHIGLIYLVPGRTDTLRINGRATLVRDAPFFDQMIVKGHRPVLAVVVHVEQIFYHCSKAFLRSDLWQPSSWDPTALPYTRRDLTPPRTTRRIPRRSRAATTARVTPTVCTERRSS